MANSVAFKDANTRRGLTSVGKPRLPLKFDWFWVKTLSVIAFALKMRESWLKRDWPLPVLFLAIVRLSLWIRERMFGGIAMESRGKFPLLGMSRLWTLDEPYR
jgi:hypothetical protein